MIGEETDCHTWTDTHRNKGCGFLLIPGHPAQSRFEQPMNLNRSQLLSWLARKCHYLVSCYMNFMRCNHNQTHTPVQVVTGQCPSWNSSWKGHGSWLLSCWGTDSDDVHREWWPWKPDKSRRWWHIQGKTWMIFSLAHPLLRPHVSLSPCNTKIGWGLRNIHGSHLQI